VKLRTVRGVRIPAVLLVGPTLLLVLAGMVASMRLCSARQEDEPHGQQQGDCKQVPQFAGAHSLIMLACAKVSQTRRSSLRLEALLPGNCRAALRRR
jgi:hypothetical protein